METFYQVTRDGQTLVICEHEHQAWRYLLEVQGRSVEWAVKHDGYDIIYPNGSGLKS